MVNSLVYLVDHSLLEVGVARCDRWRRGAGPPGVFRDAWITVSA